MPRPQRVAGKRLDITNRDAVEQGKLLLQAGHLLGIRARIDHSTIARRKGTMGSPNSLLAGFALWASAKNFLLKDVQEVEEDHALPNGISCAVNLVEGAQLLGNRRLAFKAIIVIMAVRVLAQVAISR